jgi:hypothetical protein
MRRFSLTKKLILHDGVKKFSAKAQLRYEIIIFRVFKIFIEFESIGVVNILQNTNFLLKFFFIFYFLKADGFACSDLPCLLMPHSVNHSVSPGAQTIFFVNLVAC